MFTVFCFVALFCLFLQPEILAKAYLNEIRHKIILRANLTFVLVTKLHSYNIFTRLLQNIIVGYSKVSMFDHHVYNQELIQELPALILGFHNNNW